MNVYRDATWVLEYVEEEDKKGRIEGSMQSLVLRACTRYKLKSNPKHIYALVDSAWKYKPYLEIIMKKSDILKDIPKKKGSPMYSRLTVLLLCHDLLFSKQKRIQMGKLPIKEYVLKHKTRLHSELVKLKLKLKVKDLSQLIEKEEISNDVTPVRWIRINPLRCPGNDVNSVLAELEKKFTQRVDHWKDIVPGCIYHDDFIPNVFGIHPQDKITSHELYRQGKVIIQDRASCFPAHILNPDKNDVIIDACAAPGNKTTHVAAHLLPKCEKGQLTKIYAFEKEPRRAQVLQKMTNIAGCGKAVKINVGDFTKLAIPDQYKDVTGLILDPSCSGSGIFGRKYVDSLNRAKRLQDQEKKHQQNDKEENDLILEEEEQAVASDDPDLQSRLSKLSSFQFQVVKHAMSLPNAKKIVYSTCSVHPEENEKVVIDLLLDRKVQEWGWKVAGRENVIPDWPRRGIKGEFDQVFRKETAKCQELADSCIRALPREDGGIGFFAVCFER
ncbi:hypothetical protein HG535_0D02030 [Zygotorulaspora mrakii]|uniref:SAM-dependent MTase RsmB/NOP-type domain-containing protein n=1 Tax=Zygotorulaspora mrakii TaxID=42260 RepID=A0A7H9B1F4_ZYGMR|nr:uncharacterized protein HG535_0D02030 [Zygotorulaspora mrakii]QLG72495.1 hypothetical protein HG535_0D02030 [Zygotorulaspora mrakii]